MGEPLLRVENLKKYFKSAKGSVHAVDDVSFTIEAGKTLGVVGGKETVFENKLFLYGTNCMF